MNPTSPPRSVPGPSSIPRIRAIAIDAGDGHAVVFIDERANERQRAGLAAIGRGEAGAGGPFEVFGTTYTEPAEVVHGAIEVARDELETRIRLGDLGEVHMEPLRN